MFIHKSSESLNTIMSITNHTETYLANEQRQHYKKLNSPQLIISIKIKKNPFNTENVENDKSHL